MSFYNSLTEMLLKEKEMLQKRIAAIDVLLDGAGDKKDEIKDITNNPSNEYYISFNRNLTWDDKCLTVLRGLRTAFASDIVDKISELEPELNRDKIRLAVAQSMLKLKKAENCEFNAIESSGGKFRYEMK